MNQTPGLRPQNQAGGPEGREHEGYRPEEEDERGGAPQGLLFKDFRARSEDEVAGVSGQGRVKAQQEHEEEDDNQQQGEHQVERYPDDSFDQGLPPGTFRVGVGKPVVAQTLLLLPIAGAPADRRQGHRVRVGC